MERKGLVLTIVGLAFLLASSFGEIQDEFPIYLILPVAYYEDEIQDTSYTIWDSMEYMFPPEEKEEDELDCSLPAADSEQSQDLEELSSVWQPEDLSFTQDIIPYIPWYLVAVPHQVIGIDSSMVFPEPAPFQKWESVPIAMKIIDEQEKAVKLVLGDENFSTLSFILKPDGIYDLGGSFKGYNLEFKWRGNNYTLSVLEEEGRLKIDITPHSCSPFTVSYSKDFLLGGYPGEIKIGLKNGLPVFQIELDGEKEEEEQESEVLDAKINPEGVSVAMNVRIGNSQEEEVEIKVDSLSMEESEVKGEGTLTFRSDNRVAAISYNLGESPWVEIAQNKSLDEIIDGFITEVAEMIFKAESNWCPDTEVPQELIQEIKMYLYRLFGDDKLELVKLIEEVNAKRRGLIIPLNMRVYLDFSSQKDAEFVLPIIPGMYAVRLLRQEGENEFSFLSALRDGRNVELGYKEGGLFLFKMADSFNHTLIGFEFTLSGIESFCWNVRDLEGRFY